MIEGSYFVHTKDGFKLVILTDGKTFEFPLTKIRLLNQLESGLEAIRKSEADST